MPSDGGPAHADPVGDNPDSPLAIRLHAVPERVPPKLREDLLLLLGGAVFIPLVEKTLASSGGELNRLRAEWRALAL